MLVFKYIQNGQTCGTGYGIAAEGAEELHTVIETGGDFTGGDDCGQWERVSDRFSEDDDVRDDALSLESPEMCAEAAEADLHFVGDADAACGADLFVSFGEIAGRKNNLAGDAGQCFGDVCGDAVAFVSHFVQELRDVPRIFCSRRWVIALVGTAIVVWYWGDV